MRTSHDHWGPQRLLWAACGALVIVYIFLAALGAFEPEDVIVLTVAAVVVAALWLAHEWREQFKDEQ
jgi:hypothetical protein